MSFAAPVLLEADAISKRFGDRVVLSTASLRARAGIVTGLLGRNGAGKSTLLRCFVGEMTPDQGNLRFDGVALETARRASLAKRGVCFVPDRDLLHPAVSVLTQCRWVAQEMGAMTRANELLDAFGLAHVQAQRPRSLSGGERRRAEVVLALLLAPRVLVLDEPLRGIPPIDAEIILGALREHASRGNAVVITGHELPLLMSSLQAITWCHAGKTREFASVDSAMQDFAFRRDFLPRG